MARLPGGDGALAGSVLEDGTGSYRQVAVIPCWGSDRMSAFRTKVVRDPAFSVWRVIRPEPRAISHMPTSGVHHSQLKIWNGCTRIKWRYPMALSSGDQLGHYKIQSIIGRGGMGEVYRAVDTKLEREVAVKVLPAALAADPERLGRFEREAKVLAQMNHPGIASIHGVEDRALIMELVPGPTLAELIKQGPIPAAEADTILLQIADALANLSFRSAFQRGDAVADEVNNNLVARLVAISRDNAAPAASIDELKQRLAVAIRTDPEISSMLLSRLANDSLLSSLRVVDEDGE